MATNNSKNPTATVPTQSKGQPAYSQTQPKVDGTTVAVNASEVGQLPISMNYQHH